MLKDSPPQQPNADNAVEQRGVLGMLQQSAVKALPEAIFALVMGNVAIGLAGEIWRQMTPTLPPGVDGKTISAAGRSISSMFRWGAIREHQFLIVYCIFLVHNLRLSFFGSSSLGQAEAVSSSVSNTRRRFVRDWFRLIVVNAFGAVFSAIALYWVQRYSAGRLLWSMVLQPVFAVLQNAASSLFGSSASGTFQGWIAWYGENQLKFNFWFFYLAAICDDLGLPNLKTLGRWCWHRLQVKFLGAKPRQPGSNA
jgi:hypothetical protein